MSASADGSCIIWDLHTSLDASERRRDVAVAWFPPDGPLGGPSVVFVARAWLGVAVFGVGECEERRERGPGRLQWETHLIDSKIDHDIYRFTPSNEAKLPSCLALVA